MRIRDLLGILVPFLIVALICGMAMHITGDDNRCTDLGGRLEFSARSWDGAVCVRDGQVTEP